MNVLSYPLGSGTFYPGVISQSRTDIPQMVHEMTVAGAKMSIYFYNISKFILLCIKKHWFSIFSADGFLSV